MLARYGDDVADLQHRVFIKGNDLAVTAQILQKQAPVGIGLSFSHGLAGNQARRFQPESADDVLLPCSVQITLRVARRHGCLVALALLHQIHAKQFRADKSNDPASAHGTKQIGHGIGHGNQVQLLLHLIRRQIQLANGIGRQADGCRDRLRTCQQTCRQSWSIARYIGCDIDR